MILVIFLLLTQNMTLILHLHYRLQLASVAQSVLNDHLAHLLVLRTILTTLCRLGEVNVAIANDPATVVGEFYNVAFGFEEEERLCRADGQLGVSTFATACDFGADLILKDLLLLVHCRVAWWLNWRQHTSEKTPYSSQGTSLLFIAFHTRS